MPDMTKPHNYYIVYDANGDSHYLDRYATETVTLCEQPADKSEIETDEMGYFGGIDCLCCQDELHKRVLG